MKDFYDLCVLAQRFEFESAALAAAIQATFETRHTAGFVAVLHSLEDVPRLAHESFR